MPFLVLFLVTQAASAESIGEWIDKASTYAARSLADSCEEHKPPPNECTCKAGMTAHLKGISGISQELWLASLAGERAEGLKCAREKLEDVRKIGKYRDEVAKDTAARIEDLIDLRRQGSEIENEMKHLSQLGEAARPGSPYYEKAQRYNKIIAAQEAVTAAIPFIEIPQIQELVRERLQILGDGRGPRPSSEAIAAAVNAKIDNALASAVNAIDDDVRELRNGTRTAGASLSRAMRESLAQDTDLTESMLAKSPRSKYAACEVDAAYGAGAQRRDKILLIASIGLSIAPFGAATVELATAGAAARGVAAAVRVGRLSAGAGRILRAASIAGNLAATIPLIDKACNQYNPQFRGSASHQCQEIDIKSFEATSCAASVVVSALGLGVPRLSKVENTVDAVSRTVTKRLRKQAIREYPERIERIAPLESYPKSENWRAWNNAEARAGLPDQGWKLHVGATPESAAKIAETLLPELRKRGIMHKVIDDMEGYAARDPAHPQAGKFITIYPRTDAEAREIARLADDILKRAGFTEANFIKPPTELGIYPGVTGRFGRYTGGPMHDPNGYPVPGSDDMVRLPDGRYVPDNRNIPHPPGMRSPFFD